MAVDTRSRRASVIGIGLAAALTLPLADATVGQPDRQHVAFAYPGITATDTSLSGLGVDLFEQADPGRYFPQANVAVYFDLEWS